MIVNLDVPYTDSQVTDLSYRRSPIDLPVLDTLEHPKVLDGWSLSLHLLGASHQAVLKTPWGVETETVACMRQPGARLPMWSRSGGAKVQMSFRCHVHTPSRPVFAERCAQLRRDAQRSPHTLVGIFPGDHDALTYLSIIPGIEQCRWRTVHAYPERRQLVVTDTVAAPSGPLVHSVDSVRSVLPPRPPREHR